MTPLIRSLFVAVCTCVFFNASATAAETNAPTVSFAGQGLRVDAPAGAAYLDLRIVDPLRTLICDERTRGEAINWYLDGTPREGEYRYEAVAVTNVDGKPRQANASGGFRVEGGVLIAPAGFGNVDVRREQREHR